MFFTAYLAGLAAGAGLIIAIGAQNAFVLRHGLQRHYIGSVVLVCLLADIGLILLGVAGMGRILACCSGYAMRVPRSWSRMACWRCGVRGEARVACSRSATAAAVGRA